MQLWARVVTSLVDALRRYIVGGGGFEPAP
jgi:hypothetical protein